MTQNSDLEDQEMEEATNTLKANVGLLIEELVACRVLLTEKDEHILALQMTLEIMRDD